MLHVNRTHGSKTTLGRIVSQVSKFQNAQKTHILKIQHRNMVSSQFVLELSTKRLEIDFSETQVYVKYRTSTKSLHLAKFNDNVISSISGYWQTKLDENWLYHLRKLGHHLIHYQLSLVTVSFNGEKISVQE